MRLALALLLLLAGWGAAPLAAEDYVVRGGDSLSRIAERELGSTARWREIATLNDLRPPYELEVGQRLRLPGAESPGPPPTATAPATERRPERAFPIDPTRALEEARRQQRPEPAARGLLREAVDRLRDLPLDLFLTVLLLGTLASWTLGSIALRLAAWHLDLDVAWGVCFYLALLLAAVQVGVFLIAFGAETVVGAGRPETTLLGPALIWLGVAILAVKRVFVCPWRVAIAGAVLTGFWLLMLSLLVYLLVVVVILGSLGLLLR